MRVALLGAAMMLAVPWAAAEDRVAADDLAVRLDQLIMTEDYAGLAKTMQAALAQPDQALVVLRWERDRLDQGAGLFVAGMRAVHLYTLSRGAKPGSAEAGFADLALETGLYALALIEVDGARCAEVVTQNARRSQFAQILAPIWGEFQRLGDDEIAHLVGDALLEEQTTAGLRGNDPYLCRGVTPDLPVSVAGRVRPRPPQFRDEATAQTRIAAARATLPGLLVSFAAAMHRQTDKP